MTTYTNTHDICIIYTPLEESIVLYMCRTCRLPDVHVVVFTGTESDTLVLPKRYSEIYATKAFNRANLTVDFTSLFLYLISFISISM